MADIDSGGPPGSTSMSGNLSKGGRYSSYASLRADSLRDGLSSTISSKSFTDLSATADGSTYPRRSSKSFQRGSLSDITFVAPMDDAIPSLPPPTLRSPLFSADTIVVMYPHLIDAIAGSLPSDAYEWNSQEIAPPVVSIKEKDSDAQSTMSKESKDDKESKHKDKKHKDEEKPKDTVQSVLQKDGRGHVVWNLIETERSYVSQLAVVQNYFRHKLLAEGILSETATNLIFAGIDELLVFHESFSAELETLVAPNSWNTSTTRIGALFIRHKDTLVRIYTRFIDSYAMSQKLMKREEKENPHYINFMKDALKHKETNRQQLKDFMILPVQRTARYHLLLKDLKNRTEESHPDFEDLHSAHEAMSALASAVNEKKRKEEEATGLFEAFEQTKNCPPTLIKHTRKLILNVDAVETLLNGKQKQIHLFLCSDLLMVTSVSGGRVLPFGRDKEQQRGFKFIRWLDLMEISVEYLGDTDKAMLNTLRITYDPALRPAHISESNTTPAEQPGFSMVIKFDGYDGTKSRKDFILAIESECRKCREGGAEGKK